MDYINKTIQNEDHYLKKKGYRCSLKKKITNDSKQENSHNRNNPFSQQLTPWIETNKLQTSLNLLKQQPESKMLYKNRPVQSIQPSVEQIVSQDFINYSPMVNSCSKQKSKELTDQYTYPRLKISSQEVIVSRNKKEEAKRFLFNKKPVNQNKKTKKIANLIIQWDDDIIYNPEKKYFEQQILKRKLLKQFSQSKNDYRHGISKKDLNVEEKIFKIQPKKVKSHKKEISIISFKKKQNQKITEKIYFKNQQTQKHLQGPNALDIFQKKQNKQKNGLLKISHFNFDHCQSLESRAQSPSHQSNPSQQSNRAYRSDKWKFRSSLKSKRHTLTERNDPKHASKPDVIHKYSSVKRAGNLANEKQVLNRITLEINQKVGDYCGPLQVFSKTSTHFFRKSFC